MIHDTQSAVSETDLHNYTRDGYALVRDALPPTLLKASQELLEEWVNTTAKSWCQKGLIKDLREDLPFRERFNQLWNDAGCPSYPRSPRKPLVDIAPERVFEILTHRNLIDLAEAFLGTSEIACHGVWNSRPKTPDATFTDTPWHQDAQYFRNQAALHIMTIWFPLHEVDENSSCLAIAPGMHKGRLYDNYECTETGFIGIPKDEIASLPSVPAAMQSGDALCFSQLVPHRAMPNRTRLMRWSMDLRFMDARQVNSKTIGQGLVVSSHDPTQITSYEEWLAKWANAPW